MQQTELERRGADRSLRGGRFEQLDCVFVLSFSYREMTENRGRFRIARRLRTSQRLGLRKFAVTDRRPCAARKGLPF